MSLRKKRLNMLQSKPRRPKLRFSPTAWAKLLFLRDLGPTEVGAFGITRPDDLLLVDEIQLVHQRCTETFVAFDDVGVGRDIGSYDPDVHSPPRRAENRHTRHRRRPPDYG